MQAAARGESELQKLVSAMGEIVHSSAKIADITSIIDNTIQQNATVSETVAKTAGEMTHESKSLLRLADGLRGVVNGRNAA